MMTKFSYDSNGGGGGGNVYATHTHTHTFICINIDLIIHFDFQSNGCLGYHLSTLSLLFQQQNKRHHPFYPFKKKRNFFHTDFFPFFLRRVCLPTRLMCMFVVVVAVVVHRQTIGSNLYINQNQSIIDSNHRLVIDFFIYIPTQLTH